MGSRRIVGAVAALAVSLVWGGSAAASQVHVLGNVQRQVYFPGVGYSTDYADNYDTTAGPLTGNGVHFDDVNAEAQSGMHLEADSYGGAGYVGSHAYVGWNRQVSSNSSLAYELRAESQVDATFDDLLITAAGGPATITTSINFSIHGEQTLQSFLGTNGTNANTAYVVSVEPLGGFGFSAQGGVNTSNAATPQVYTINGPFNSPIFRGTLTTASFTAPVNTPFSVRFLLDTGAIVSGSEKDDFLLFANNDFGTTLSFATDRPVFNLPAGYSAGSASANIADNTFTLVPEPGFGPMTALITLGTVATARRRERSRARR